MAGRIRPDEMGGTYTGVSAKASCHERRRARRGTPWHSANTTARTCTFDRATAIPRADRAGRGSSACAPWDSCGVRSTCILHGFSQGRTSPQHDRPGARPFVPNVAQAKFIGARACNHDELDAVRHEVGPLPKTLAAKSLDAAARRSMTDLLRDDHAKTWPARSAIRGIARTSACCYEQNEMRSHRPLAFCLNAQKIASPQDAPFSTKSEGRTPHYFL